MEPNYYVNEFMISVLRDWVEAGSGDEWGEQMTSMLNTAETVSDSHQEVSDYLWKQVLNEIPYLVYEHLPNYGSDYMFEEVARAIGNFPARLNAALNAAWNENLKHQIRITAESLPLWMIEHGHIQGVKDTNEKV